MSISLLRYTIFMQSAGTKLMAWGNFPRAMNTNNCRSRGELSIYLESRYGGIDTGIQIRCPLTLHYSLLWGALAVHITGSQFLRGNLGSAPPAVQSLRIPIQAIASLSTTGSPPHWPGISLPPSTSLSIMRSFPRCKSNKRKSDF